MCLLRVALGFGRALHMDRRSQERGYGMIPYILDCTFYSFGSRNSTTTIWNIRVR